MPTVHFKNEIPKKYNPQNTSREVLKKTFSIRLKEYKKIWEDIRQAKMDKPEEHYIVQGVRGSGKTTLLTRLAYAVEDDKKLSKKLIVVQFKEEEYGVSTLFSMWLRIAEDLEEHEQVGTLFAGLADEIESLEMDEGEEAKSAFRLINKRLEKHKKKIILLIDNIADLFDVFNTFEKDVLREVLSQNANLRIIGGSAISLEAFYDNKDPFYQFFKIITLKKLTQTETIKLLKILGKTAGGTALENIESVIKNEPEKIESIRRLTGGIPRTIILLFEILADGPKGTTFQMLDDTLDMASPIYKHRMDDLTKQQKPIVHAIAQHWDAISTKEIVKKTRLKSKDISAQLAQLEKQWIIEKIKTNSKNNLYRLQERFFNIWYLMRYGGRRDKKKMRWLTQFLETWCTPDELKSRALCFSKDLTQDAYMPGTLHYAKALMATSSIGVEEKEAIYHSVQDFCHENGSSELLQNLPEVGASEYHKQAHLHQGNKEYEKAKECYESAIKKGDIGAYSCLGDLYTDELKAYDKAEQAYQQAIEKGDDRAYLNLGNLYKNKLKAYDKAEQAYKKAIKKGIDDAYFNLGNLYTVELKAYDKAEQAYQQAIEKGIDRAYLALGHLYENELKEFDKAEKVYNDALNKGIDRVYFALANFYSETIKDNKKSEKILKKAVDKNIDNALNALAWMYFENKLKNKKNEALKLAFQSIQEEEGFEELHTYISIALWNTELVEAEKYIYLLIKMDSWKECEWEQKNLIDLFLLFLAKGQTNLVDRLLKEYDLVDTLKPLYYTVMHLMKDKYPNEYLRMGSEMQETVDEMLAKVEQLKKDYK